MAKEKMTREKRKHFRVPITAKVKAVQEGENLFFFTKNISVGGLFLKTSEEVPIGTLLELEVAIQGVKNLLKVKGKVTRIDRNQDGSIEGVGVQFIEIAESCRTELKDFVERDEKP